MASESDSTPLARSDAAPTAPAPAVLMEAGAAAQSLAGSGSSGSLLPGGSDKLMKALKKAEEELQKTKVNAVRAANDAREIQNKLEKESTDGQAKGNAQEQNSILMAESVTSVSKEIQESMLHVENALFNLFTRVEQIQRQHSLIKQKILPSVRNLQRTVKMLRVDLQAMTESRDGLQKELEESKQKVTDLESNFEKQVEKVRQPLVDQITQLQAQVQKQVSERAEEKKLFAHLWPEGFAMPTILTPFYIPTEAERLHARKIAEKEQELRAGAEEVKTKLMEKSAWTELADDYGRLYFSNNVTGESTWLAPAVMKYQAPEGWDTAKDWWKPHWGPKGYEDPAGAAKGKQDAQAKVVMGQQKNNERQPAGKRSSATVKTPRGSVSHSSPRPEEDEENRHHLLKKRPSSSISNIVAFAKKDFIDELLDIDNAVQHQQSSTMYAQHRQEQEESMLDGLQATLNPRTFAQKINQRPGEAPSGQSSNQQHDERAQGIIMGENIGGDDNDDAMSTESVTLDVRQIRTQLEEQWRREKKLGEALEKTKKEIATLSHQIKEAEKAELESEARRKETEPFVPSSQADIDQAWEQEVTLKSNLESIKKSLDQVNTEKSSVETELKEAGIDLPLFQTSQHQSGARPELPPAASAPDSSATAVSDPGNSAPTSEQKKKNEIQNARRLIRWKELVEREANVVRQKDMAERKLAVALNKKLVAMEEAAKERERVSQTKFEPLSAMPEIRRRIVPPQEQALREQIAALVKEGDSMMKKLWDLHEQTENELSQRLGDVSERIEKFLESKAALEEKKNSAKNLLEERQRPLPVPTPPNIMNDPLPELRFPPEPSAPRPPADGGTAEEQSQRRKFYEESMQAYRSLLEKYQYEKERLQRERQALLQARDDAKISYEKHLESWKTEEEERVRDIDKCKKVLTKIAQQMDREAKHSFALQEELAWLKSELDSHNNVGKEMWQEQTLDEVEETQHRVEDVRGDETVISLKKDLSETARKIGNLSQLVSRAVNKMEQKKLEEQAKEEKEYLLEKKESLEKALKEEKERKDRLLEERKALAESRLHRLKEELMQYEERIHQRKTVSEQWAMHTFLLLSDGSQVQKPDSNYQETQEDSVVPPAAASAQLFLEVGEKLAGGILTLRKMREMSSHREQRWRTQIRRIRVPRELWAGRAEQVRHQEDLLRAKARCDEISKEYEKIIAGLRQDIDNLKDKIVERESELKSQQLINDRESEAFRRSTQQAIELLKKSLDSHHKTFDEFRERNLKEKVEVQEKLTREIKQLVDEKRAMEETFHIQKTWLDTLRTEMSLEKASNAELLRSYQALELRKAEEVDSLHGRIADQNKRIDTLNMWAEGMKLRLAELQEELKEKERAVEYLKEIHRKEVNALKWEIWRQKTAAVYILSHVDALFSVFSRAVCNLAGSSRKANDTLREYHGIDVLTALCHCNRVDIKRLAARAIGSVGWDGFVDERLIGWRSQTLWDEWLEIAVKETLAKIPTAPGRKAENQMSDEISPDDLTDSSNPYSGGSMDMSALPMLQTGNSGKGRRRFSMRNIKRTESANVKNQELLGQTAGTLKTIVDLCGFDDWEVQRASAFSLAIVSMHERNNAMMGRMAKCVSTVITLCSSTDNEVVMNAATALANMAYHNPYNQEQIAKMQGLHRMISLCKESTDVDILDAATAAIANLCAQNEKNGEILSANGGIDALVDLLSITSHRPFDGSDRYRAEDIEANASEALANATKSDNATTAAAILERSKRAATASGAAGSVLSTGPETSGPLDFGQGLGSVAGAGVGPGAAVRPFVLMLGSQNEMVRLHAGLILGNLSQNDTLRMLIGTEGGIDGLFTVIAEELDKEEQEEKYHPQLLTLQQKQRFHLKANCLWALSNLAWNVENQERIGKHFEMLMRVCRQTNALGRQENLSEATALDIAQTLDKGTLEAQEHAVVVLANCLFYNEENRQKIFYISDGIVTLLDLCTTPVSVKIREHATRAIAALAYNDSIAVRLGELGAIDAMIRNATLNLDGKGGAGAPPLQKTETTIKYAVLALLNLSIQDINKKKIIDSGGVEVLVQLQGSSNKEIKDSAIEILSVLANIPDEASLQRPAAAPSMEGMVAMCKSDNDAVAALAAESIADEVWKNPALQKDIVKSEGIRALLEMCRTNAEDKPKALLASLWALRNATHHNSAAQTEAGSNEGIPIVLEVCRSQSTKNPEAVEAALGALLNFVIDHEQNSRRALYSGLDTLIDLAEQGSGAAPPGARAGAGAEGQSPQEEISKSISVLATNILQIIGPFNYVICANCGSKEPGGAQCSQCGHAISFNWDIT